MNNEQPKECSVVTVLFDITLYRTCNVYKIIEQLLWLSSE
jgi:hypothetical protein